MTKSLNDYLRNRENSEENKHTSLSSIDELSKYLKSFTFKEEQKNSSTKLEPKIIEKRTYTRFINEFWTSKQRQASSVHEVSYRACFKPQLPAFFIKKLTSKNDVIYDPFSGRGTTVLEAGLLGRNIIQNDINPLSKILLYPRFFVPKIADLKERLESIKVDTTATSDIDLIMFYEKQTLQEILAIRSYLQERKESNTADELDTWIRMIATNRLTGHSTGFFSVYTLPPNQAVSQESQKKINEKRNQKPGYRNTREIILKKSRSLIKRLTNEERVNLRKAGEKGLFLTKDATLTPEITDNTVKLTVTSPPFLDIVQYAKDNWLRCWFNDIDMKEVEKNITMAKTIEDWSKTMSDVFTELYRITKPGGWVAFEVGEVRKGKYNLDEYVVPIGIEQGFVCAGILINEQEFTKTANIWGIENNKRGTNSNRIAIFRKE